MTGKQLEESEIRSLYERHAGALTAYACSFRLDFSLAQDMVQQVFFKILKGGASLPDNPAGYLYRAVRNTCLNRRRDGSREVPLERGTTWLLHRTPDHEAEIALQSALTNLSDEQREVVIMHIWDGMTLDEVASATSTSLNTAASRYRYALDHLRKFFGVEKRIEGKGEQ